MISKISLVVFAFILLGFTRAGVAQETGTKSFEKAVPWGNKPITLVINPGHGGKDTGRLKGTASMMHEKDINLIIALKMGKYVEERIKNIKVIYTRTTDTFVSLDKIVDIANENNADYFISIHCNSNPNKAIYGTRSHIHSHSFKTSQFFARLVEDQFAQRAGRKSRGIRDARERGYNLQVLQYTKMPGVLVEVGFITNPVEERYLNSEYGQDIIASALFRAFRDLVVQKNKAEDRSTVYKVQIMASTEPVNLNSNRFKKLGMRIEEHASGHSVYKYRYLVGQEYDPGLATKLASEVKKKGFKDAFVVSLQNDKAR